MKLSKPVAILTALGLATALGALTGCGGGSDQDGSGGGAGGGGTFVFASTSDPGALDPQLSAVSALFALNGFGYDSLVAVDDEGEIGSQLAESWNVDGTTATFTLRDGITCSDGSAFTASVAAENINWMANPENLSPYLGAFLPAGVTAEGDDSSRVLTLTLAGPAPFLLQGLADLSLVCKAGLDDRSKLAAGTSGTGPYELSEAVPEDHYTYKLREDYAWGPFGATAAGLPATVTMRVIPDETTAANLLAAKEINQAMFFGSDVDRVTGEGYNAIAIPAVMGEVVYNQSEGHAAADPAVRMALTQAVDLEALQVALTSGRGSAATGLAVVPPVGCDYDAVKGNVPAYSAGAAASALEGAGWAKGADGIYAKDGQPLALTFVWDSALGTGGGAAAELAVQQWAAAGIKVEASELDAARVSEAMFATGAWDILWEPINLSYPDQIVGFMSGPSVAEGGTNFAAIKNADYDDLTAQAMETQGVEGCPVWQQAETALFKAADIVPFANQNAYAVSQGATMAYHGRIVPTSVKLTP
jgi:peptide/nickel transport system substrate-binding protein